MKPVCVFVVFLLILASLVCSSSARRRSKFTSESSSSEKDKPKPIRGLSTKFSTKDLRKIEKTIGNNPTTEVRETHPQKPPQLAKQPSRFLSFRFSTKKKAPVVKVMEDLEEADDELHEKYVSRGGEKLDAMKPFSAALRDLRIDFEQFLENLKVRGGLFNKKFTDSESQAQLYKEVTDLFDKLEEHVVEQMLDVSKQYVLFNSDVSSLTRYSLRQLFQLSLRVAPRMVYIVPQFATKAFTDKLNPREKKPKDTVYYDGKHNLGSEMSNWQVKEAMLSKIFMRFFNACKLNQQALFDVQVWKTKSSPAKSYAARVSEKFSEAHQKIKEKLVSQASKVFENDGLGALQKKSQSLLALRSGILELYDAESEFLEQADTFNHDCSLYIEDRLPESGYEDDHMSSCPCDHKDIDVLPPPKGFTCVCVTNNIAETHKRGYLVPIQEEDPVVSHFSKFTVEAFQCIVRHMYDPNTIGFASQEGLFRVPGELSHPTLNPFHPINPLDICVATMALGQVCAHHYNSADTFASAFKRFLLFEEKLRTPESAYFTTLMQFLGKFSLYAAHHTDKIKSKMDATNLAVCLSPNLEINSVDVTKFINEASLRPADFLEPYTNPEPCAPFDPETSGAPLLNCLLFPDCAPKCDDWTENPLMQFGIPHSVDKSSGVVTLPSSLLLPKL